MIRGEIQNSQRLYYSRTQRNNIQVQYQHLTTDHRTASESYTQHSSVNFIDRYFP
jgi:hypothetical protein